MRLLASAAAFACASLIPFAALAAPGELDPAFGVGGIELIDFGATGPVTVVAAARQPDGKTIVAGNATLPGTTVRKVAVGRLNADGTPDMSFGAEGWTYFHSSRWQYEMNATAVAVQPDGKILVAGSGGVNFLVRFDADGGLDMTFGTHEPGLSLDFTADQSRAVAVLPTGRIVVAGSRFDPYAGSYDTYVSGFTGSNGHRDFAFGSGGTVTLALSPGEDFARAILVRPDGNFYLAGHADGPMGRLATVTRLYGNGTLDYGFGYSATRQVDFTGWDEAHGLAFDSQQRLLLVGRTGASGPQFAIARMDASTGELDTTFNYTGRVITAIPGTATSIVEVSLPEPGLVAFGTVYWGAGQSSVAMVRYQPWGGLAYDFGQSGVAIGPSGPDRDSSLVGSVAADGSLVSVGVRTSAGTDSLLVARYFAANGAVDSVATTQPHISSMDIPISAARMPDGRYRGFAYREDQYVTFGVLADGSPDFSVGPAGYRSFDANMFHQVPHRAVAQPDGKLVVLSLVDKDLGNNSFYNAMGVSRLNADGTRDTSFNGTGDIFVDLPGSVADIALQPDGKIVALVRAWGASQPTIGLARVNADGTLDSTFGGTGIVKLDRPGVYSDYPERVRVQPDGRIVVAARTQPTQSSNNFFSVIRVLPGGTLDPSWGTQGAALAPGGYEPFAMALQSDGKTIVGGSCNDAGIVTACLTRFAASGAPDATFNGGAMKSFPNSTGNWERMYDMALQSDGKIVGVTDIAGITVLRFLSDGTVDGSFNGNGTSPPVAPGYPQGVYVEDDGKVTIFGGTSWYDDGDVVMARFQGGGDTTPDAFAFTDMPEVPLNYVMVSNAVTLTGFDLPAPISVQGGEYSVGCGPVFTGTPGTITAGYSVCVRHTTSATPGTVTNTTLTVGGVSDVFTSTTGGLPDTTITMSSPDPTNFAGGQFSFTSPSPGATFECQLDGSSFTACTSPASYTGLADGSHSFAVRAVNGIGTDPTPATRTWTIDTTAPETTLSMAPSAAVTSSNTATATFGSNDPAATFECRLDGGTFAPCPASPATLNGLADGPHTFQVRARDALGNTDATPASHTWTIDTTAPNTLLAFSPFASPTNQTSFSATLGSEIGATYQCRVDGSAWAACTSPVTQSGLADGSHTFEARAVDGAGNVDPTPATHAWTIDTVAPDTTIVSGPAGAVASSSALFSYSSSESPSLFFECQLDAGAWTSCGPGINYASLADGSHTFSVRAKDMAGNIDPTPASRTWVVDTVAPDTAITSGPSGTVASGSASVEFAGEAGAAFQCSLDGGAFVACTSPTVVSGLGDGAHTVQVAAVDGAGNVDASPASISWIVDTTAPQTAIDSGPSGAVASTTATFTYNANEVGATFECRLDGGAWVACNSAPTYSGLAQGSHLFEVRSTDAVGNVDATPASRGWVVDTVAPNTTITSAPGNNSPANVSFSFTSSEPGGAFECRMDTAAFAACASPQAYSGLAKGSHTFQVRARDAAGNLDATPASHTWRVK